MKTVDRGMEPSESLNQLYVCEYNLSEGCCERNKKREGKVSNYGGKYGIV